MSGEILRAVLDKSCLFSAPNWYTIGIDLTAPQTTGVAYLETKVDRLFLVTAITAFSVPTSNGGTAALQSFGFQVTLPRSSRVLFNRDPLMVPLMGNVQNFRFTLPEYVLLESNDLVQFNVSNIVAGQARKYVLTMHGIEYGK